MKHSRFTHSFFISILALALFLNCGCPPLDKSQSGIIKHIEAAEHIIKAVGISTDGDRYSFEVLEVYKGDFKVGQIVDGESTNNCEIIVDSNNTYILFGYISKTFRTSICHLSFNVDYPMPIPPPPPPVPDSNQVLVANKSQTIDDWKIQYDFKSAKRIIKELKKYKRKQRKEAKKS